MIKAPRIYKKEELTFANVDGKVEVSTADNSAIPILTSFQYEDLQFPRVDDMVVDEFNIKFHQEQYLPSILHKLADTAEEIASPLTWKRDFNNVDADYMSELIGDATFVIASPKICTMIQLRRDFEPLVINCYRHIHEVGMLSTKTQVYRDVLYQEIISFDKSDSPPEFLITDTKMYWIRKPYSVFENLIKPL